MKRCSFVHILIFAMGLKRRRLKSSVFFYHCQSRSSNANFLTYTKLKTIVYSDFHQFRAAEWHLGCTNYISISSLAKPWDITALIISIVILNKSLLSFDILREKNVTRDTAVDRVTSLGFHGVSLPFHSQP